MALTQSIGLSCDRQPSMQCDRCVLKLQPSHLIQTDEKNHRVSKIRYFLTYVKHALDQEGIIALTNDGQVHFMTLQAKHLLEQYFSLSDPHSLPDPLQKWFKSQISQLTLNEEPSPSCLPLRMEQSGQQLIIHFVTEPIKGHYLLLLEERKLQTFSVDALELLGLTKREAEVLFWIAKDKSNSGIAKALGCCEGTVRKHLENLYKKLGVQTRIGAVMVALETLGLFQV